MNLYDTVMQRERAAAQLQAELEQARREEEEKQRLAEKQDRSPAERLIPGREQEMVAARDRPAAIEPDIEEPEKIAERMGLRPKGLQLPPSPGGGGYVNPLAWRPTQTAKDHESLIDRVNRELREQYKAQEKEERDRQNAQRGRADGRSL